MEGSGTLGAGKRAGAPTSPIIGSAPSPTGQTQHEVLQNFFKSLLNTKDRAASPSGSGVSPGAGAGKAGPTGPRTPGGAAGGGGLAEVGSGTEDG